MMTIGAIPFSDKVRVPARPAAMVRRQRLLDRLHGQVDRRLILVTAPGGYGKTTLLADFASDAGFPVAWYCAEPAEHELRSFARYLALSIQQQFPRFGGRTLELIDANPDRALDARQFVSTLAYEIEQQAPSFFSLVLDDYHTVAASQEVNEAVDLLLAHLPENCRLIISGRSIPTKLRLTRLAAQQHVAGIGANDLAFTVEEIQELVRARFQVDLEEAEASELRDHSHGWITAVLLSGSLWSGQLAQHFPHFTNSATDLFSYLTEEVLALLDIDRQEFLLGSSILTRVEPHACDAVLGRRDSARVLEELSQSLLFVTKPEGDVTGYRYHPLFQEYLAGKLRDEHADRHEALHLAAGRFSEDAGDPEGAVEYYLGGGHPNDAARLIEATATRLMQQGKWLTLRSWLDRLPPDLLPERPELLLVLGQVLGRTGQVDRALLCVREAQRVFIEQGDSPKQAHALLVQSRILLERGEFLEMGNLARAALDRLPVLELELRSEAHQHLGISLRHQGRIPQALAELTHALQLAGEQGDLVRQATMERSIASVFLAVDRLEEAETHYRTALTIWQQLGDVPLEAAALNGLAIVAERRGDYEASGRMYREGLQKVRDGGPYPYLEANISRNLAEQAVDLCSYGEALRLCDDSLSQARAMDAQWLLCGLQVVRARTLLALGRVREAGQVARAARRGAQRFGSPQYLGMAAGCLAAVAAEEGRENDACNDFERAVRLLKRAKVFRELARTQFRYALYLGASGELGRAAPVLRAALDLVTQIGQETLLVVEASQAPELLQKAVDAGLEPDRLRPLLARALAWREKRVPEDRVEVGAPGPWLLAQAFGASEITRGGVPVAQTEWVTARAKELFYLLLTHPGGLRKDQIITDLWPDASPSRGNSQFHTSLHRVRRAVSAGSVVFAGGRYRIDPELGVWYDVAEFQRLLSQAFRAPLNSPEMAEFCRQATGLYRGPFLTGFYSEWVQALQERLQTRYLQGLARLSRYHEARGEYRESVEYLELQLAVDNTLEPVHLELMRVRAQAGDPGLAVQHYLGYAQWVLKEFGVEPSAQLRQASEVWTLAVSESR